MPKNRRLIYAVSLVLIIIIWNYPLTYRIAVNGKILEKDIPLYAKACGFLYRDWSYREIVRRITRGHKDDLAKVLAIFHWTGDNVRTGIPAGLKMVDDHPLNIIIRGYGGKGQVEDIFTILCSYAGVKAAVKKCYNHSRAKHIALSFVYIGDRWLIFDASSRKYFLNKSGNVAGVEDHFRGNIVMTEKEREDYAEFLDDSGTIKPESIIRVEEQMPSRRIQAQIRRLFIKKSASTEPAFSTYD